MVSVKDEQLIQELQGVDEITIGISKLGKWFRTEKDIIEKLGNVTVNPKTYIYGNSYIGTFTVTLTTNNKGAWVEIEGQGYYYFEVIQTAFDYARERAGRARLLTKMMW